MMKEHRTKSGWLLTTKFYKKKMIKAARSKNLLVEFVLVET